ncbi:MAG: glyoxalase [Geodermatophilaceae bacterium]|nr:glyoxalase [Geodermatophilaceae bacterium]
MRNRELGYIPFQDWASGRSWRLGATYLVVEQSPALTATEHDRQRPGMNHLAFHAGDPGNLDLLADAAPAHGWILLFADTHPHAGGQDHYAAYFSNSDDYEVELVANEPQATRYPARRIRRQLGASSSQTRDGRPRQSRSTLGPTL